MIRRRGGLGGIRLAAVADQPSTVQRAAARECVHRVEAREVPPASHPDAFSYRIEVSEGGVTRSALLGEDELPEPLRPLLDGLEPE